jgi:hypothetical protein
VDYIVRTLIERRDKIAREFLPADTADTAGPGGAR